MLARAGALTALLAAGLLLAGLSTASAAPAPRPASASASVRPAVRAGQAPSGRHGHPVYYVALGDSLAQGVQPATPPLPPGVTLGQSIETDAGYANDLYDHYKRAFGGALALVKLGCPGETTPSAVTCR